jgi:hypothetical protein
LKVTRLRLPDGKLSVIVFLLSFFTRRKGSSSLDAVVSGDFIRPGSLSLDFLFASLPSVSIVGAVVIISGAMYQASQLSDIDTTMKTHVLAKEELVKHQLVAEP